MLFPQFGSKATQPIMRDEGVCFGGGGVGEWKGRVSGKSFLRKLEIYIYIFFLETAMSLHQTWAKSSPKSVLPSQPSQFGQNKQNKLHKIINGSKYVQYFLHKMKAASAKLCLYLNTNMSSKKLKA